MLSLTLARAPSRLAALHSRCSASAFLALRRRPKAACASPASGGGERAGRAALWSPRFSLLNELSSVFGRPAASRQMRDLRPFAARLAGDRRARQLGAARFHHERVLERIPRPFDVGCRRLLAV